jgi:hypothetical protein
LTLGEGGVDSRLMSIYVRLTDGGDHLVEMQSSDEEDEIGNILRGDGWPYDHGWVQLHQDPPRYVALRHVLSVEIREAKDASASPPRPER